MKTRVLVEVDVESLIPEYLLYAGEDLSGRRAEDAAAKMLDEMLRLASVLVYAHADRREWWMRRHSAFEVVFPPKQLFTDEQRAKVMELVDLREYANNSICGDGLEIDRAQQDFAEMSDLDVVSAGILNGISINDQEEDWESNLRQMFSFLPDDVVESVVTELKGEEHGN